MLISVISLKGISVISKQCYGVWCSTHQGAACRQRAVGLHCRCNQTNMHSTAVYYDSHRQCRASPQCSLLVSQLYVHSPSLQHRTRMIDHITPVLHQLHWLLVHQRITFKLDMTTFKCLHSLVPSYLTHIPVTRFIHSMWNTFSETSIFWYAQQSNVWLSLATTHSNQLTNQNKISSKHHFCHCRRSANKHDL